MSIVEQIIPNGLNYANPSSLSQLIKFWETTGGYVYLMLAEGSPRFKIGYSANVKKRRSELSYQSPYPIKEIFSFWSPNARLDEAKLHTAFAKYRVYGEWFECLDFKQLHPFSKWEYQKFVPLPFESWILRELGRFRIKNILTILAEYEHDDTSELTKRIKDYYADGFVSPVRLAVIDKFFSIQFVEILQRSIREYDAPEWVLESVNDSTWQWLCPGLIPSFVSMTLDYFELALQEDDNELCETMGIVQAPCETIHHFKHEEASKA